MFLARRVGNFRYCDCRFLLVSPGKSQVSGESSATETRLTTRRLSGPHKGESDTELSIEVELLEKVLGVRERLVKEGVDGEILETLGEAIKGMLLCVAL